MIFYVGIFNTPRDTSSLYQLKRRIPPDKIKFHDISSTSHIPPSFTLDATDYSYLLTEYGEEYSMSHNAKNLHSSKVHDTYEINTELVNIDNHNFVENTTSPCVLIKQMYRRLCGTSLYEVSKYSYDDKNNSQIFNL